MPTGPQGQKRPADAIGCAVMVGKIATGDAVEQIPSGRSMSARSGGMARATALSAEKRSEIATSAANARWKTQEASMENSEYAKLAANYAAKREAGLLDVKFLLNGDKLLHEDVCAESNRLDKAIADGAFVPLVFDDRHHAG